MGQAGTPRPSPGSLTSPFFTVMDCRRGVISSLMLDRKFCEIRRASCSRGWSGWLEGVCFSKSCARREDSSQRQHSLGTHHGMPTADTHQANSGPPARQVSPSPLRQARARRAALARAPSHKQVLNLDSATSPCCVHAANRGSHSQGLGQGLSTSAPVTFWARSFLAVGAVLCTVALASTH